MSPATFWSLVSSAVTAMVTLFGVFIAQRSGFQLFAVAKKEHDLNVRKASPIIGSVVKLAERQILNANYRPFHFIVTSICNYGDLPAQQLSGSWRLYSPDNCIKECNVPIQRDALGPTPYDTEEQLIGPNIDAVIKDQLHKVAIHVDIEFDYFGISQDRRQHYSASYQYDHNSRRMMQVQY
jgi:hypothetical protein